MNKIKTLTLIFVVLTCSDILPQESAYERSMLPKYEKHLFWRNQDFLKKSALQYQRLFDISGYHLQLELEPAAKILKGAVTLHGSVLQDPMDQIELDLGSHMIVDSILQTNAHLAYTHSADLIKINLPEALPAGSSFSVTVYYHGDPEGGSYGAFNWDVHGPELVPVIWTLSEPYGAPSWWPCKDDPSDKADSVRLDVTVPENLVVASNGLLHGVTETTPGLKTYTWITRYPISTYLVSLAVTDYVQFEDAYDSGDHSMPLVYFVYPELYQKAVEDFSVTKDMLIFYSQIFGEYPFVDEKYGMAVFPWGGGMEHQTLTSYGAGLVRGDHRYDYLNAHELAHQWFGDQITMRYWSHIWLNEGFASYAEALWFENLGGEQAYHSYMRSQYRDNFQGSLFIEDSTNISALFSGTVYDKGSWVLHMLRGVLGDSVFFDCLRAYVSSPIVRYGNAVTEDFQYICEQTAGYDLSWFFDQWIYRAGRPSYAWSWHTTGAGPFKTELSILQNTPEPYKMPIQIRLAGTELNRTYTVWDSLHLQSFTFTTDHPPTNLTFDPENWILKHTEEFNAEEIVVSNNYPNPFNSNTQIDLYLPVPGQFDFAIFNTLGQLIYRSGKQLPSGYHPVIWDGKNSNGHPVSSGIYFARVQVSNQVITRKLALIR